MRTTLILTGLVLLLSACNTLEGIGRDMRSAGEGIADGAGAVKEKIRDEEQR